MKYWREINPILSAMLAETEREVKALFDSPIAAKAGLPTMDDTPSISKRAKSLLDRLMNKYTRIFNRDLGNIVLDMMAGVDRSSALSLGGSLSKMGEALTVKADFLTGPMKEQFKAMTIDNVSLFKTIASTHFDKVETAVMNSIVSGNGLKDLKPFFDGHSNGTKNYGRLRALDQTRKAFSSINAARMQKLGVKSFIWMHSHGSNEPRKLHESYDGKVFEFDKPPVIYTEHGNEVRGLPGQAIYCRCAMKPVFEFDDDE
ncbi:MAG: phage minor head protein [Candidatus Obscuribacterales bacterium]|jgi:hypothetical protein